MNAHITYNRALRRYQAVDPDDQVLADFPAGPDSKRIAERWLIAQQNPAALELAERLARNFPVLADRAFRAALIVAAEGVASGEGGTLVQSQADPSQVYPVRLDPPFCPCEDYARGLAGELHGAPAVRGFPRCKHVLAAMLAEKLAAPEPEPIPAEAWDRYYQEREQFEARLAALQAGVNVLI